MSEVFLKYLEESNPETKEQEARDWYREKADQVQGLQTQKILRTNELTNRLKIGRLYLFKYDAKGKETLPYYDVFPIIFVIQPMKDGFLGLNMHYLPYQYRATLMDGLYDYVIGQDTTARLRMTYSILQRAKQLRFYRPCVKHYLNNQVRSRFLQVHVDEWDVAMFLPLQKFIGASLSTVHRDSRKMIRNSSRKVRL